LLLFDMRPATAWRMTLHKRWIGDRIFAAKNPPYGAIISYYLKSQPAEKLKIAVEDQAGKLIRAIEGGSTPGYHRVNWDLRYPPAVEPTSEQLARMAGSPQFVSGFSFPPRGPMVEPGQYLVRITAGKHEAAKAVIVEEDPRVHVAPADRRARHEAVMRSYTIQTGALRLARAMSAFRSSIAKVTGTAKSGKPAVSGGEIRTAALRLDAAAGERQRRLAGIGQRAERLMAEMDGFTAPPTGQQDLELRDLDSAFAEQLQAAQALTKGDLTKLNRLLQGVGQAQIAALAIRD
jgi:hypothetical protein